MRIPIGNLAFLAAVESRFAHAALFELIRLGLQSFAMVAGRQEVDLDDFLERIALNHRHDAQPVQLKVQQFAPHRLKCKND